MTLLRLDHVVIAVRDLERAVGDCESAGYTVMEGGRHPGRNTRNALVVFEDGAYLELITYSAPSPDERWWRQLDAHGDGLVDFALLPHDLPAVVAEAKARGLAGINGPLPGGRLRPDGQRVQWQTARQSRHDLPFLCADLTPRALRVPEGEVRHHANGATGIAEVTVAVADVDASLARYRAFLGDEAVQDGTVLLEGARIVLVRDAARQRDEGPCGVHVTFAGNAQRPLDLPFTR
ncbi:VOC family protein [Ramlibacter albus]|uniref:VOC family protein n=1 Tax=Ramlibacter albus TaxID=2079448 RepID=A0A923S906_9BURK|nr:VOC family protein [Ramlibacter albus]MBC5768592.1 VOC family protein [Ramlibacter albus]